MSVVLLDGLDNPLLLLEHPAKAFGLAIAELQHEPPIPLQERGGLARQPPPVIQAIGAAIERPVRVKIAHLRLQRRYFAAGDVGRVADDEVKAGSGWHGRKAVAFEEAEAPRQAVTLCVLAGDC